MPQSIRSFDRMTIPAACNADWDSMIGDDKVRFCEHCNLHVTNLSNITRQEAMSLVTRSEGRLCVRFVQRPNGTAMTKQMPQKLHQTGRRVSRFAAGAFTASLSLTSAAAQSQSAISRETREVLQRLAQQQPMRDAASSGISGTIKDPNEAVVAGASVTLINSDTNSERQTTSSDEGEYFFENVAPGSYQIRITLPGFKASEINGIQLSANANGRFDATLEVGAATMGVIVMATPQEPLVKAAFDQDIEAVEQLAFASLDVNVRDKNTNMTALDQAVENNNLEIVRILLRAGANVNARNDSHRTPLMFLRESATVDLVRELLSAGAKVNARDESGGTALMNAASECKYEIVKELIDARAEVEPSDANGNTALIFAARNEDALITKLLIDNGADVNAAASDRKSALMAAAEEGDPEVVKLLISFNADVNAIDNNGWSALMYVAGTTDVESAHALLNAGADVSVRDKDGKTALALAHDAEHREMIKLLESRGVPE